MDPHILSSLPQSLASRTTRRTTLAGLGGCGLAAGLLGALGLRGTGAALAESVPRTPRSSLRSPPPKGQFLPGASLATRWRLAAAP
jgi:hypothetical protein